MYSENEVSEDFSLTSLCHILKSYRLSPAAREMRHTAQNSA